LSTANLFGAVLGGANLSGAALFRANLFRANLSRASLSGANLSEAEVKGAIMTGSRGLSKEQIADLKRRGAIFDDAPGDRESAYSPNPRVPR
ncbi:MAG: pentapeptide repeat-containing protein, partial [Synechococcales bacterium]|nr:pentapeptide repeat-containing protein [Synechococcales bacterium]